MSSSVTESVPSSSSLPSPPVNAGDSSPSGDQSDGDDVNVGEDLKEEEIVDLSSSSPPPKKKRGKQSAAAPVAAADAGSAMDRLNELLRRTEQFAQFVKRKEGAASSSAASHSKRSHQQSAEAEEDEQLIRDEEAENESAYASRLSVQPPTINGTMKTYQLESLNWLIRLHDQKLNGILADEMGLGKTLQSLSILSYLKECREYAGPHLIIVPKSTSTNWMREIKKWTTNLDAHLFHGNREDREAQKADLGVKDITVTTYEVAILEKAALKKIHWHYLLIDEAHRIKNENSLLSRVVRTFDSEHRVLITGTPLQNNLHELWALLNFLVPSMFDSAADFESWFDISQDHQRDAIVSRLHKILRPFLLRRMKSDVEQGLPPKVETKLFIGLSALQRKLYTQLLERDIDVLNSASNSKTRLLNIVMQLRKCTSHPYLFIGMEPQPYQEGEHLIENSGKMVLLDKLLKKLKAGGHRVLIFSQMTRLLDILEDYCNYRGFQYCRIDGQTSQEDREDFMDQYNAPNSQKFVFLLSTRAGGLGINLQTADTVILFDSDWNPQMDLQAMDRAHRIGQKRQVNVYRFVVENSIEEKIVERATKKLYLDALVIKQGKLADENKNVSAAELQEMVKFGASRIFQSSESTITDEDIDLILARGRELTEKEQEKLKANTSNNLRNFTLSDETNYLEYDGKDYSRVGLLKRQAGLDFVQLPQRQRKENYDINAYYREALRVGDKSKSMKAKEFKPTTRYDFQFFQTERLDELEKKEFDSKQKLRILRAAKKEKEKMDKKKAAEAEKLRRQQLKAERKAARMARGETAAENEAENDESSDEEKEEKMQDEDNTVIKSENAEENAKMDTGSDGVKAEPNESESIKVEPSEASPSPAPENGARAASPSVDGDKPAAKKKGRPAAAESDDEEGDDGFDDEMVEAAGCLTDAEKREKERLEKAGFGDWQRKHFMGFIRAMEKFGRDDLDSIIKSEMIEDKTEAEIRIYHTAFWKQYKSIKDHDKYIKQIERGEMKLQRAKEIEKIIDKKVRLHKKPMESMTFQYQNQKLFSIEEDRFLICAMHRIGYGNWDILRHEIRSSWLFRFDWWIKSRSSAEIAKRCDFLIQIIEKEIKQKEEEAAAAAAAKKKAEAKKAKQANAAATATPVKTPAKGKTATATAAAAASAGKSASTGKRKADTAEKPNKKAKTGK